MSRNAAFLPSLVLSCVAIAAVPENVPELLKSSDGKSVETAEAWSKVRRPEILETFTTQVFGVRPVERPAGLSFRTLMDHKDALLTSAVLKRTRISWKGPRGMQSMNVTAFFPLSALSNSVPCLVFMTDNGGQIVSQRLPRDAQVTPEDLDETWPVQHILKRGYATVAFDVTDIAEDDFGYFRTDVFDCFQDADDRTSESWGALSAWAWGASRVMDWLETERLVDKSRVAVAGHGRCGKAALWAGATDRRFAMVCAACTGTCGAKLNHISLPESETLCQISRFRHWFCRAFDKHAGKEMTMPFDQHWLLSLTAPRLLCVVSALEDAASGPEGEFHSVRLASPAWELHGYKGCSAAKFPSAGGAVTGDRVSYSARGGDRALKRADWDRFMDLANANGWRKK